MDVLSDRSAIGAVLVDVAVTVFVVVGLRRAFRRYRNPSGLATLRQVCELAPKAAARTATRLRASLKDVEPRDVPGRPLPGRRRP